MNAKEKIVQRIRLNNSKPYCPKFGVGDIILNKRDKIIRKVKEITVDTSGIVHSYLMTDLQNPLKNPRNMKYDVIKEIRAIDCFYEKLDEKAVKILFGTGTQGRTK